METLELTQGQKDAAKAIKAFLTKPGADVFVLEGYSGTGKTTLIRHILEEIPKISAATKLVSEKIWKKLPWKISLTATTNKAAANFADVTGEAEVKTVHSHLGLRLRTNYQTGSTHLKLPKAEDFVSDEIILIDEASYIDDDLLLCIQRCTVRCKIIFMGDPAQLLNVGCDKSPVFDSNLPTARLTEVVRQAKDNQIQELSTQFRHMVNTGEFETFIPNGTEIVHVGRDEFDAAIIAEFTRKGWSHQDSRVLVWTNAAAVAYNKAISREVSGSETFVAGDYAIVNSFVKRGNTAFSTDAVVKIESITDEVTDYDIIGRGYTLDGGNVFFMPDQMTHKKIRLQEARQTGDYEAAQNIHDTWIDLRAAYASTINKSQGSTFDKVFIDLTDVSKCTDMDRLARMLYVGVSRARTKVYLHGDLS